MFTRDSVTEEQIDLLNRLYDEVSALLYADPSAQTEFLEKIAETIMELHRTEKKI